MSIRIVVLIGLSLLNNLLKGQDVYKCRDGYLKFYSHAPVEDIEAVLKDVNSALNSKTGEIAVLLSIKSFVFDNALMQEHFNEDYMESEKYPIAIFKGKIIEPLAIKIGTVQEIQVSGDLTIHGITQNRTISVTLKYEEAGRINAASKFIVRVADHKIKIPQMVFTNIAEAVDVTMNFNLISK